MNFQPFTVEGALVLSLVSCDDPGCMGTGLDSVNPAEDKPPVAMAWWKMDNYTFKTLTYNYFSSHQV